MKVLHINTYDIGGGAARATYRLHNALLTKGVESHILVQIKMSDDFKVISEENKFKKILLKLNPFLDSILVRFYKYRNGTLFSPALFSFGDVVKKINLINPDIVHLHWICGGMVSLTQLSKINKPIVWTLHDNWAFTGGCHIMRSCDKYQNTCGGCPVLGSNNSFDLSRVIFNKKKNILNNLESINIIGVSEWITNCSKNSSLLSEYTHNTIPNSLNTNIYRHFDKKISRDLWKLPQNKKLVLFGAMNASSDRNKGFQELSEALHKLTDKNIEFVIFGSSEPQLSQNFGFKTHYLGHLHDDVSLVTLYSAVDVMIVPSLQESFGQTASEAMACETPVVAFAHTGLLDIIDHKINGYLATPFDTTDLANGIEWILNTVNYDELCKNAREKVLREFDSTLVAERYIQLYQTICEEKQDHNPIHKKQC